MDIRDEQKVIHFVENIMTERVVRDIEVELRKKPYSELEYMLQESGCHTPYDLARQIGDGSVRCTIFYKGKLRR